MVKCCGRYFLDRDFDPVRPLKHDDYISTFTPTLRETVPNLQVDIALDCIIKSLISVGGKGHDSLVIFQLA